MLNFEGVGQNFAIVKDKTDKPFKTISISDNPKKVSNGYKEIQLSKGYRIQQIPNKDRERDVLYVAGQSGSGKSYYTLQFAKEYHKMFPKNDIYLFSTLSGDSTLDKVDFIKKIKLSDEFLNTEFTHEDFSDSLVIMDDVDTISNNVIKKKVFQILNMLLETGRHSKTSIIYTSHLACKGHESKTILNEAHSVTVFCKTMGSKTLKYLLDNYFGLSKQEIDKLKVIPSRFITIMKTYPTIAISEKSCFILH
jgi:hypothetical protein